MYELYISMCIYIYIFYVYVDVYYVFLGGPEKGPQF